MAVRKKKDGKRKPWVYNPRLPCLGRFCSGNQESKTRYGAVHDVDIMNHSGDGEFLYRTRLCPRCQEGVDIRLDRGDVNAGK